MTADPRLLARFDGTLGQWHIASGTYSLAVGKNAEEFELETALPLDDRRFGR